MDKKKHYDEKYKNLDLRPSPHFDRQFEYILKHYYHGDQERPRILDLGGGTGEYSLFLQSWGYPVTLLDFSEVAVEKAKKLGVKKVLHGDFLKYDFQGATFDIILVKGFSLFNTDDFDFFKIVLDKIDDLRARDGLIIYWSTTKLKQAWRKREYYHQHPVEIEDFFSEVVLLPVFRYQAYLPKGFNDFLSKLIIQSGLRWTPKMFTLLGLKW